MKSFYTLSIIALLSINIIISYYFYIIAMLSWGEGGSGETSSIVSIVTATITLIPGLVFIVLIRKAIIENNKISYILVIIMCIGTIYPLISIFF